MDFVQNYRANAVAERLRQTVSFRATVLRDGKPLEIVVSQMVHGDVVVRPAGDLIPADGRILTFASTRCLSAGLALVQWGRGHA